jgi:hypothetical protein
MRQLKVVEDTEDRLDDLHGLLRMLLWWVEGSQQI